ncbi:unnamed protein product [Lactuca saligna]|uniref:Uncharacterized protein n=1 Tax=Lactuca saligna TaxID=75948 RepID=A0AA35YPU3_LACSI|nr:unnamed protein product [Lactuca saligna]
MTGVFQRIKMKSKHKSLSPLTNVVRKPQVSHQGVIFREITAHVSPSSKKRRETDMAKHISKKKKKVIVVISSESTADEIETIPETPEADLQKDDLIPPEVSIAKTVSVEAQTSDIIVNISNMDASVTMGEDASHVADKSNSSDVTPVTTVSFSSQVTLIIPTTSTTESPSFATIIQQPFTSMFSSQSIDQPTTTSPIKDSSFMETEHESEVQDIEYQTQFNSSVSSRSWGGNSVTSLEVYGMLKMIGGRLSSKVSGMIKDSETRLLEKIDNCDKNKELRVNAQKSTFNGYLKSLKSIVKERYILFIQDVKKVREDIN